MRKSHCVLNIFLASPSDVTAERIAAEEVVTSINKGVGRQLGWQLDLHKWEETPPGFGRPQDIINPSVDDCELFIGLLGERWGQPTGNYSSGFEEEFSRARERRKAENAPEIWLFFKHVDSARVKDAGPQLSQVLKFREKQTTIGEVLFREVQDIDDWKTQLREWLVQHAIKLHLEGLGTQKGSADSVPILGSSVASNTGSSVEAIAPKAVPRQLESVIAQLHRVIQSGNFEFSQQEEMSLKEFDVARLYLLSATLMTRRYSGDVLGTHEINLLYKHRQQLEATPTEELELLRTVVGNKDDVVPGWFWFRDLSQEGVENWLLFLINQDSSDSVRARALEILNDAGIRLPALSWPDLPLNDDSLEVRNQAYDYLASVGDENALVLLDELVQKSKGTIGSSLNEARLRLLVRLDPSRAFSESIMTAQYLSVDEIRILRHGVRKVEDDLLLQGVDAPYEPLRRLLVTELARRRRLPTQVASKLIGDPSLTVRALALESLAKDGALPEFQKVRDSLSADGKDPSKTPMYLTLLAGKAPLSPDSDSIIVTFYRTQNTEDLLQAVDWYSIDGPLAYRALVLDRYDAISSSLREDMLSGFKRIKDLSSKAREKEYGPDLWNEHSSGFDKYDDLTRTRFTEAALLGLAANGQPGDADLARPYLTNQNSAVRDAAVDVISKFGNSGDVNTLLSITTEAWGDVRQVAAAAALGLSSKPLEVARRLMKHNDSRVVRVTINWLFTQDSSEVSGMFRELLNDEDFTKRMQAVHYCSARLTREQLEQLLKDYTARETYYYNVATWLDRLLYSPEPLRSMFVNDLKKRQYKSQD